MRANVLLDALDGAKLISEVNAIFTLRGFKIKLGHDLVRWQRIIH